VKGADITASDLVGAALIGKEHGWENLRFEYSYRMSRFEMREMRELCDHCQLVLA